MTWSKSFDGYIEIETSVLISGVIKGHPEIVQIAVDELIVIHLEFAVLLLHLLLLHLSYKYIINNHYACKEERRPQIFCGDGWRSL